MVYFIVSQVFIISQVEKVEAFKGPPAHRLNSNFDLGGGRAQAYCGVPGLSLLGGKETTGAGRGYQHQAPGVWQRPAAGAPPLTFALRRSGLDWEKLLCSVLAQSRL